jgi:hypothetical protein
LYASWVKYKKKSAAAGIPGKNPWHRGRAADWSLFLAPIFWFDHHNWRPCTPPNLLGGRAKQQLFYAASAVRADNNQIDFLLFHHYRDHRPNISVIDEHFMWQSPKDRLCSQPRHLSLDVSPHVFRR